MVDRTVEETLFLGGMQVDRHDAVSAGGLEQVKDKPCGDGFAPLVLLVLTRVTEERRDHGDGTGGSALQRIDHDELFHNPLVDRHGVCLHHEHVGAAHRLGVAHVHLSVGVSSTWVPRYFAVSSACSGYARPVTNASFLSGVPSRIADMLRLPIYGCVKLSQTQI